MSVREQKRAEWDARKLAQAQAQAQADRREDQAGGLGVHSRRLEALDTSWRFGVGPNAQERAEIHRAQLEGRAEEYVIAQAAARAHDKPVKIGGSLYKRLTAPAKPTPKPPKPPAPKPAAPPRSEPLPPPIFTASGSGWSDGFLADHARGLLPAVPIPVPANLPTWTRPSPSSSRL